MSLTPRYQTSRATLLRFRASHVPSPIDPYQDWGAISLASIVKDLFRHDNVQEKAVLGCSGIGGGRRRQVEIAWGEMCFAGGIFGDESDLLFSYSIGLELTNSEQLTVQMPIAKLALLADKYDPAIPSAPWCD